MIWLRTLHRWIGLILGIQLLLWMLSGLVMGLLPHEAVTGHDYQHHKQMLGALPEAGDFNEQPVVDLGSPASDPVRSISLRMFEQALVYRIVRDSGIILLDAKTGQAIEISDDIARRVAIRDYSGPGEISKVELLEESTLEMRGHAIPAWRIDFKDLRSTSLYISAQDGAVLERRNTYWRIFDVFWMLHIMDYQQRTDFNNTLIIICSLILLWMGISGILLWADSFQREEFAFVAKWRARTHRYTLNIFDSEGGEHKTLSVRPLQTLFESMAAEGLALPSSCGGGGTCGLCRVRISPDMKISAADQRRIPQSELDQGYRLACQHRINADASITLPHGLLDAKLYEGTVVSSRFVTPFICDIRIRLNGGESMPFRAGSYIQVRIPPFQSELENLAVPEHVRGYWIASQAPTAFGTTSELYRTYSISSAPGELQGDIALNVRMAMPKPDKLGVPIGIGSAYLATLKAGSALSFKGPLGDFRVHESTPELVFIGGGAGMGPLRSMILDQLLNQRSSRLMSFWYGARTSADLYYTELFDQLQTDHENFSWQIALSDDNNSGSTAPKGYIHELVREKFLMSHPDPHRCSFHICGPPAMLEAVMQLLQKFDIAADKITFDDFGS